MRNLLGRAALMSVAALTLSTAAVAQPGQSNQCFRSDEWRGWKAADDKTMYINVRNHEIYRLDMAGSCFEMTQPDAHLVTVFRGSTRICSPLDIDLKVSTNDNLSRGRYGAGDMATPCIVSRMTRLTPSEAAALPPKLRP